MTKHTATQRLRKVQSQTIPVSGSTAPGGDKKIPAKAIITDAFIYCRTPRWTSLMKDVALAYGEYMGGEGNKRSCYVSIETVAELLGCDATHVRKAVLPVISREPDEPHRPEHILVRRWSGGRLVVTELAPEFEAMVMAARSTRSPFLNGRRAPGKAGVMTPAFGQGGKAGVAGEKAGGQGPESRGFPTGKSGVMTPSEAVEAGEGGGSRTDERPSSSTTTDDGLAMSAMASGHTATNGACARPASTSYQIETTILANGGGAPITCRGTTSVVAASSDPTVEHLVEVWKVAFVERHTKCDEFGRQVRKPTPDEVTAARRMIAAALARADPAKRPDPKLLAVRIRGAAAVEEHDRLLSRVLDPIGGEMSYILNAHISGNEEKLRDLGAQVYQWEAFGWERRGFSSPAALEQHRLDEEQRRKAEERAAQRAAPLYPKLDEAVTARADDLVDMTMDDLFAAAPPVITDDADVQRSLEITFRGKLVRAWLDTQGPPPQSVQDRPQWEHLILATGMARDGWGDDKIFDVFSREDWYHGYSLCQRRPDEAQRRSYLRPVIEAARRDVEALAVPISEYIRRLEEKASAREVSA